MTKTKKKHLIFDLDDTLVKTSSYLKYNLLQYLTEIRDYERLEIFNRYLNWDTWCLPEELRKVIQKEVERGMFMLEGKPTKLYCYYFLIPGNLDPQTKVSICSMRGHLKNGMKYTKRWLESFKPYVNIQDIHLLDVNKTQDKLGYLEDIYGDDFLLIDDNPYYDVGKSLAYEKDERVIVYDECVGYPCYANQNRVVFDISTYKVNGEILR